MPDILGFSPRPREPEELLAHGERLLEPPLERWTDPAQADRPAVRGTYAGRRTTL